MQPVMLDARLESVAEMIPKCRLCADIGADHGFLSARLLESGRVQRMYVCDISAPSLDKARKLFAGREIEARARFEVGDGLEKVEEPLDACAISGMGGETIMGILTRGRAAIERATLVLQPNVDAPEVRRYLYLNGFHITDENLVFDQRWWYFLIKAEPGKMRIPTERELLCGPILIEKRHKLLPEYARRQTRILDKAARDLDERAPHARELMAERAIWEDVAKWQA